jgi:GT2 family glycosyltransferase
MQLSILIVSYNTRDLTLGCLRSVLAETKATEYEVLVVDNASRDGSADAIAGQFPSVSLTRLDQNIGFGAGVNLAAGKTSGDLILLLNPDTIVVRGAIDELVAFAAKHPDAGIWGGKTIRADGVLNPESCWAAPTLWGLLCQTSGLTGILPGSPVFNSDGIGGWKRDRVRGVPIVSGCFLLIGRKLWRELGGFDPQFFMYGEDFDLCLRARRLGAAPLLDPEAVIVHHGGASETIRHEKMMRLFRAKALLFRKHWSARRARVGASLLDVWSLSRMIAFGILSRLRPSYSAAFSEWREVFRSRRTWHESPVITRAGEPARGSVAGGPHAAARPRDPT